MAKKKPRKEWTTMYIPKENVADLIEELQALMTSEFSIEVKIPKYTVLETALREAIERRQNKK